jgi:RHS repeat-associated protein
MERRFLPGMAKGGVLRRNRGASIVEAVIALPVLLVVILGAIQFGLVYEAKAALNHASLQAARAGAVNHADPNAIRRGLARGLVPLFSPESSLTDVARLIGRIDSELATDARIRILNPTREAFDDFGTEVDGQREIPNDRLYARSTAVGSRSGLNIQDANLLKVQVTYGFELHVPLVNWFIAHVLLGVNGSADAFEQQLLRRNRLPIMATATVRMQTPARLSDAVMSLSDLPNLDRIPSDAAPPPVSEEDEEATFEEGANDSAPQFGDDEEDEGSSLGDGFFGFGGGDPSGGGSGGESGGIGGGGGVGGGINGGSPLQCNVNDGPSPFPFGELPGESSPVPLPNPTPWWETNVSGSEAGLESISLAALSVGNPIHVATGNKFQTEIDIPSLSGLLGIGFKRHYNSAAVREPSILGAGWRHSYQASLRQRARFIEIVQADGRLVVFEANGLASGTFVGRRASDGEVVRVGDAFRWRWPSGRELVFDAAGRPTSIRESGRELLLRYNDAGQLLTVMDPQQRKLQFEYYANGRLAKVRGPGRFGVAFKYDARGNLVEVVRSDRNARRYTYEDERHPHHLSTISVGKAGPQPYGKRVAFEPVAQWKYDDKGRAVFSSHPDDAGKVTLRFERDFTEVTDAFDRKTRYFIGWRKGAAVVTKVEGPGCSACGKADASYAYDDALRPLSVTVQGAAAWHYVYDPQGRLHSVERDSEGRRQWIVRYGYDEAGRIATIERPSIKVGASASVVLTYARNGLLERFDERGFTPRAEGRYAEISRTTRVLFDDRSRIRRIDGPRTDVQDWIDIEYDDWDRLVAIKTPAGEKRILAYDAAGRPTHVAQSGRPNIKLTYDANGRIASVTHLRAQGALKTTYSYDHARRLAAIEDPLGRRTRYGFDAAGRPNRMTRSDLNVVTIARYAADDNLERIAAFDAQGQLLRAIYYAYDDERRLVEIRDGEGAPLRRLVYADDDARPDVSIDPLGNESRFSYDSLGRISSVMVADGGVTRVEQDAFGRMTAVFSANGAQTTFLYDDFGRRVFERSADRGETRYVYDLAGNLVEKIDARGARTRLEYDAANRLVAVARAEGKSELTYAGGMLRRIDGEVSDESFEYDADGQLIEHRRTVGNHSFKTRFTYDQYGRLATRELPSGVRLRYRYGSTGVLQSIVQERWRGERVLAQVDAANSLAKGRKLAALGRFESGNGIEQQTTFDARKANMSRRAIEGVAKLLYGYDDAGRIERIDRDGRVSEYSYDAIGRLVRAETRHERVAYRYDSNGNRVSGVVEMPEGATAGDRKSSSQRYEYEQGTNQLLAVDDVRYEYDAAGNPVRIGARRYEYDTAGRPTRLYEGKRLIAEYRYNFWGERIQKTVHAGGKPQTRFYIYEDHKLIAEADERGKIEREYVYLDHHPIAMFENGEVYWIHTDHLGTPIAVTDARRRIIWNASHRAFGEAIVDSDPDGDGISFTLNLRFPGQYADVEAGTHYNYFRDYDPKTGRYLTPDPIGLAGGKNPFAYASGDPNSATDVLGLYDVMVHYYMTYFLGLVAGLPQDIARTIAVATIYIDENPLTMPTREIAGIPWSSNGRALPLYHFVLDYDQGQYGDTTGDRMTRFYDPWSSQLQRLYESTDRSLLQRLWIETHPTRVPGLCPVPSVADINNARYQLFGEFLHAYEDTFSHRDSLNMPYAIASNPHNTPIADEGHFGLQGPSGWGDPDQTFNADYRRPSECLVLYVLAGPTPEYGLTEQQCAARGNQPGALGSRFTPPPTEPSRCEVRYYTGAVEVIRGLTREQCAAAGNRGLGANYTEPDASYWRYNELRTLRMEYEVLQLIQSNFAEEIQRNVQNGGRAFSWADLAGQPSWNSDLSANSRIGLEQTFEEWAESQGYLNNGSLTVYNMSIVLQQYNASTGSQGDRLEILNDWLREHDLPRIEPWRELAGTADQQRDRNIGWIPSGSLPGVLLPADR